MPKIITIFMLAIATLPVPSYAATLPSPGEPFYFLYDLAFNTIMRGWIGYILFLIIIIFAIGQLMHWDNKTFTTHEGNPVTVRIGGLIALIGGYFLWEAVSGDILVSLGAII